MNNVKIPNYQIRLYLQNYQFPPNNFLQFVKTCSLNAKLEERKNVLYRNVIHSLLKEKMSYAKVPLMVCLIPTGNILHSE